MPADRIGIVTLQGDSNYGNRLQNFALQEAIRGLGFEHVDSIVGLPRKETKPLKAKRLALTAYGRRQEITDRLLKRSGAVRVPDEYLSPAERNNAIQAFSDEHIHTVRHDFGSSANNATFAQQYSHLVVGSDQVWNPAYTHANPEWFLSFAHPEQRVAYAASVGVPQLPTYVHSRYRKGLAGIKQLSVREHQAATTVRALTGITPPVVLDPTMLLTSERWSELARTPQQLASKTYIATFMLSSGDTTSTGGPNLGAVHARAQHENLEIVDLHSPTDPELIAMGPLEFIGAIQGAELLVTDSFHATVFATLFHVPFLLVPRGAMNSRFETLLEHIGLNGRLLSEVTNVAAALEVDWANVDERLASLRRESLDFLTAALNAT